MSNIFGKTGNKSEEKLVGAYIPQIDANRLALYSVLSGKTRTAILKNLINNFLDETPGYNEIVSKLSEQICGEWVNRLEQHIDDKEWAQPSQIRNKWWTYRKEVKKTLLSKRIPKETTLLILDKAERLLKDEI